MLCLLYIYCFFPLFSLVDPETDVAPVIDYVNDDTSSFSTELPGKQTPLDHPDIAYSFPLLLSLEYCYCFRMILFCCIACPCYYC